jgi:hypothetical protein
MRIMGGIDRCEVVCKVVFGTQKKYHCECILEKKMTTFALQFLNQRQGFAPF